MKKKHTHVFMSSPIRIRKKETKFMNNNEKILLQEKQFLTRSKSVENKNKYPDLVLKKEGDEIEMKIKSIKESDENSQKCPKCNTLTDKINSDNQMVCLNCFFQWCWICNGKYNLEHYEFGSNCFNLKFSSNGDEKKKLKNKCK